jgi:hypothetical protein
MEYLEIIIKGILCGILSAFLIIYGLRPAVPYPDALLEFFENPWLFLILLLATYYVFIWDHMLGALLLLSTSSLIFDYIVFTRNGYKKTLIYEHMTDFNVDAEPVFEDVATEQSFHNILIDNIKMQEAYPGDPAIWYP